MDWVHKNWRHLWTGETVYSECSAVASHLSMKWEGNEQNKTNTKKNTTLSWWKRENLEWETHRFQWLVCRNRSERDFTSTIQTPLHNTAVSLIERDCPLLCVTQNLIHLTVNDCKWLLVLDVYCSFVGQSDDNACLVSDPKPYVSSLTQQFRRKRRLWHSPSYTHACTSQVWMFPKILFSFWVFCCSWSFSPLTTGSNKSTRVYLSSPFHWKKIGAS